MHQNSDLFFYVHDGTEVPIDITKVDIMSHNQSQDLESCMETVAFLLPYLTNKDAPVGEIAKQGALHLPDSIDTPYEIREVITQLFDDGSFIELQGKDALPLVTICKTQWSGGWNYR